jgi:hypothetical protein
MMAMDNNGSGKSYARDDGIATQAVYPQTKEKGIKSRKK